MPPPRRAETDETLTMRPTRAASIAGTTLSDSRIQLCGLLVLVDQSAKDPTSADVTRGELAAVGASYSVTSCDLRILMDQPTESISS